MGVAEERLISDVRRLEALGPRLPGSDTHRVLVADVASRLQDLGLAVVRDRHTFRRWSAPDDPGRVSLQIDGTNVEVSSAFPYSGATGPGGVSGELCQVNGLRKKWSRARGTIAVVEVPHVSVPFETLIRPWNDRPREPIRHPVVSAGLLAPKLDAARKEGVTGVICVWRELSAEEAKGQYVPFTEPYHDLPAVWVAGRAGERVLAAARAGRTARLLLDASLTDNCEMETVWAVSRGETNETILVVTHSDGTNAVEENGHIGLLELARDAVLRPHRRNIVFVLTAGHLRIPAVSAHGQATSAWLEKHRDQWIGGPGNARAVAGLVIEHLGARKILGAASTQLEPELLYATTPELRDLVVKTWSGAGPAADSVYAPGPLIHFGEAEPLYERGIPAIALVSAPQYLLAERDGSGIDVTLMSRQIESFRQLQRSLDGAPAGSLGVVSKASKWQQLKARVRVALIVLRATRRSAR